MQIEVPLHGGRVVSLDDGVLGRYPVRPSSRAAREGGDATLPRRCYAAGHVVMRAGYAGVPHCVDAPGSAEEIAEWIDWDSTMAQRVRVDELGMGIAEAMDTAQRFELGWLGAKELLTRTGALELENGFVGAASTDHLPEITSRTALIDGLVEQVAFVRSVGGLPIVLPQPWLTESHATEAQFVEVYTAVIDASEGELLLHWLGEAFHPAMGGYFPGTSLDRILEHDPSKVRGLKLSLLDRALEERLRAQLTGRGQVVLTGDDYHFGPLIEGGSQASTALPDLDGRPLAGGDFSHALLGIFDAAVRPASAALVALGGGDLATYRAIMGPCEALGRAIFEAPVQRYKSGIALLAWLNGLQPNPMLPNHEEACRDLEHYLRVADLASRAGVIEDAALAAERLQALVNGIASPS